MMPLSTVENAGFKQLKYLTLVTSPLAVNTKCAIRYHIRFVFCILFLFRQIVSDNWHVLKNLKAFD